MIQCQPNLVVPLPSVVVQVKQLFVRWLHPGGVLDFLFDCLEILERWHHLFLCINGCPAVPGVAGLAQDGPGRGNPGFQPSLDFRCNLPDLLQIENLPGTGRVA